MTQLPLKDKLIVFDLDGTLVDTAPDLHRVLNIILTDRGLEEITLDQARASISHGARVMIERAARFSNSMFNEDELDTLTAYFVDIYSQDIAQLSRPFDGVEAALTHLSEAGAKFCICTNKRTHLAKQLISELDMTHHFESIIGADAAEHKKPHANHFLTAVNTANGDPAQSIMIGDSEADVGTARNANAPVILVSFGYTDIAPEELSPDAIISHFSELPETVLSLLR